MAIYAVDNELEEDHPAVQPMPVGDRTIGWYRKSVGRENGQLSRRHHTREESPLKAEKAGALN